MRVTEDRYVRDLRRLNLARRFLRYQVRTQSICEWTGLSDLRVRTLFRAYDVDNQIAQRHRGPSPTRIQAVLRSPILRCEASAIAVLGYLLGAIPFRVNPDARRTLPSVEAGERLCKALEIYRRIVPSSTFTMDQFILVTVSLAEGTEVELRHCSHCHGSLLLDKRPNERALCPWCRDAMLPKNRALGQAILAAQAAQTLDEPPESAEAYQQPLFLQDGRPGY